MPSLRGHLARLGFLSRSGLSQIWEKEICQEKEHKTELHEKYTLISLSGAPQLSRLNEEYIVLKTLSRYLSPALCTFDGINKETSG